MKFYYLFLLPIVLISGNIPFQVGEILHYQASFANVNAAEAKLHVVELDTIYGTPVYHVQFSAKTKGVMNYIFPIKDEIDLWLDTEFLFPLKIKTNISEGSYKKQNDILIPKDQKYLLSNNDTINIDMPVHSPYSLFYYIRKSNFSINKDNLIHTIENKMITPLKLQIAKNIKVRIPAGEFTCFQVTPVPLGNQKFKNNAMMSMLFSNDYRRYPVSIRLNLKYGSLLLELDSITN